MICCVEERRPERELTRTLRTNELRRKRLTNCDLLGGRTSRLNLHGRVRRWVRKNHTWQTARRTDTRIIGQSMRNVLPRRKWQQIPSKYWCISTNLH